MTIKPCNDCPECACLERSTCVTDTITIQGLAVNTDFTTQWTNMRYKGRVEIQETSDGSGNLLIELSTLPMGLFNEFDDIRIELFDGIGNEVNFPGIQGNCVLLKPTIVEEITNLDI